MCCMMHVLANMCQVAKNLLSDLISLSIVMQGFGLVQSWFRMIKDIG